MSFTQLHFPEQASLLVTLLRYSGGAVTAGKSHKRSCSQGNAAFHCTLKKRPPSITVPRATNSLAFVCTFYFKVHLIQSTFDT